MNTKQDYLLLVEDDPDILKLLETTLTFGGHRVVTAHNGREGLDAIQKERPAVVITDIMMPKLDGFGFVHRLRINPETRDLPVVFITATYVALEDKDFALDIGATRFIQKPVDLNDFLATVAELLKQGAHTVVEPLNDFNFYDGYRRRLEVKLEQKIKQITREERLLENPTKDGDQSIQMSLRQAIHERDELKLLLEQVHKQLEKCTLPE